MQSGSRFAGYDDDGSPMFTLSVGECVVGSVIIGVLSGIAIAMIVLVVRLFV